MEESRTQFEAWFANEHEEVENSNELAAKVMKMIAWSSWQASRAAIEIELPKNKWHLCDCIDVVVAYDKDDIDQCIRAAGLRVKEK
nr:MAG TPA: hypothetical protein [Caudoviricetes sp.]